MSVGWSERSEAQHRGAASWASLRSEQTTVALLLVMALLSGCATSPPSRPDDACSIFRQKSGWYQSSHNAFKKWGVPVHVQLSIIRQESSFRHDAQPPRDRLFGVIPWFRSSSAYGYAQAKNSTWNWYRKEAGSWGADRDEFGDATDFVAWYGNKSNKILGISKWDAYNQYLAYHEGHGGYKKKSYKKKAWLMQVADKVKKRASRYRAQLAKCESSLDRGWSLWPF